MTLKWTVMPGESQAISAALQTLLLQARTEPGCTSCSSSIEMSDRGERASIRYAEEWRDEPELQRSVRSGRFARLVELMEHGAERPVIEFVLPDGTRGVEYAEAVRSRRTGR
jgi:quinol monooxygenase YgiN